MVGARAASQVKYSSGNMVLTDYKKINKAIGSVSNLVHIERLA